MPGCELVHPIHGGVCPDPFGRDSQQRVPRRIGKHFWDAQRFQRVAPAIASVSGRSHMLQTGIKVRRFLSEKPDTCHRHPKLLRGDYRGVIRTRTDLRLGGHLGPTKGTFSRLFHHLGDGLGHPQRCHHLGVVGATLSFGLSGLSRS
ncbi:hypothetical protein D3C79_879680 [compost metagenome]